MNNSRFPGRRFHVATVLSVLFVVFGLSGCLQPFQFNSSRYQSLVLDFQLPLLGTASSNEVQGPRYLVPLVSRLELVLTGEGHDFQQITDAALQISEESAVVTVRLDNVPVDRMYTVEATIFVDDQAVYYATASRVPVSAQNGAKISLLVEPHNEILEETVTQAAALEINSLIIAADGFRFIPIDLNTPGTYTLNLEQPGSPELDGILFVPEHKFLDGNRPGLSDEIIVSPEDLESGSYRVIICLYNPATKEAAINWQIRSDSQLDTIRDIETLGVTIDISNPEDITIGNGEDIVLDQSGEIGPQTLTVTATAGYVRYHWSLNGIEFHAALQTDAETPHIVMVDSLKLEVGGVYELLLEVEIAENDWRSANLYFEVLVTELVY